MIPYRIQLTATAAKLISGFHPELKRKTKDAFKRISQNPHLGKVLQAELEGYLSYRFKRYRVIYTLDDAEKSIVVHLVRHRRDVYDLIKNITS